MGYSYGAAYERVLKTLTTSFSRKRQGALACSYIKAETAVARAGQIRNDHLLDGRGSLSPAELRDGQHNLP